MQTEPTLLDGVVLIRPQVFADDRGFFLETFHTERFAAAGLSTSFVQDNHSRSSRGVLRGLHFQYRRPQGQLVYVSRGAIFDVVVDIRPDSPGFGRWFGAELTAENHCQIYMAPGTAHGFVVLSDEADIHYKCTEHYDPDGEAGILWSDPAIGIAWPVKDPVVGRRDRRLPLLRDLPVEFLGQLSEPPS